MANAFSVARWAVFASAAAALTGCAETRDPATEEPVEVTPGMYHLSMNGQVAGMTMPELDGPGQLSENTCVRPGEERAFPRRVAAIFKLHPGCSFQPGERTGNAISGTYRCPTDGERAPGGSMNASYTGSIAADRVEIQGRMEINISNMPGATPEERAQMEQAATMMENMVMIVSAERTGDCE
jgi:hypothetical protein